MAWPASVWSQRLMLVVLTPWSSLLALAVVDAMGWLRRMRRIRKASRTSAIGAGDSPISIG
jgi:hypothetical protein